MTHTSVRIRGVVRILLSLVCAIAWPAAGLSQTISGTLVGNVTDETGLAVPGATVTITHVDTNQKREAATSATGGYNFAKSPTGKYQSMSPSRAFNRPSARRSSCSRIRRSVSTVRPKRRGAPGNGAGVGARQPFSKRRTPRFRC